MPVLIEPTLLLADELGRLPSSLAESLWSEVEKTNQKLVQLLSEAAHARSAAIDRHQQFLTCLQKVCEAHQVEPALLRTPYKFQRLVFARAQLAALLRELHQATQLEISRLICRERSTISHTLVVHRQMLETDPAYRRQYIRLKAACTLQPTTGKQPAHA